VRELALVGLVDEVLVVVIQLLHLEALGQQDVQLLLSPVLGRQILEEQQRLLELHLLEVFRELQEQGRTHVAVEL